MLSYLSVAPCKPVVCASGSQCASGNTPTTTKTSLMESMKNHSSNLPHLPHTHTHTHLYTHFFFLSIHPEPRWALCVSLEWHSRAFFVIIRRFLLLHSCFLVHFIHLVHFARFPDLRHNFKPLQTTENISYSGGSAWCCGGSGGER